MISAGEVEVTHPDDLLIAGAVLDAEVSELERITLLIEQTRRPERQRADAPDDASVQ